MCLVSSCCCGCSLKGGCKGIGWYGIICCILSFRIPLWSTPEIISITVYIVRILYSSALVYAAHKRKANLIYIYLIGECAYLIAMGVSFDLKMYRMLQVMAKLANYDVNEGFVMDNMVPVILAFSVEALLSLYFLVVANSFAVQLKEEERQAQKNLEKADV